MSQDEGGNAATGCLIAAVVVVVLVVCGGGVLIVAGALIFVRASHNAGPQVAPAVAAHADVLTIEADGTLLWNDEQVMHAELARRLDALQNASGLPRSVIVRSDPQAPSAASEQVIRMLQDRSVTFIIEDRR